MIWSLSVIISYNDDSWESAEYTKDRGGYRTFGPDVTGLAQISELFSSLEISPKSATYYRQDIKSVSYRFSALTSNGDVSVAGGINSYFITNNLNAVSSALLLDPDFVTAFVSGGIIPYLFDYDYNASMMPLYFDTDGVRVGSIYRNFGELSGFTMRWSAIVTDLSGAYWVVGFSGEGDGGRLLKLDNNLNIEATYVISGGLGDGYLIHPNEAIKVVAYDNDKFLLIQEDNNAYYLSKTGVLTSLGSWDLFPETADSVSRPDPLSLFRYNNEIYCLFESTISVGKWNSGLTRFDNIGELQFEGVTEFDMLDIVGVYYQESTGKYIVFTNDETNGYRYSLLSMPSLVVEPIQLIYGFDDDIMFIPGPNVDNTGIGYGNPTFGYVKRFYSRSEGAISFTIPFSYLKEGVTVADLKLEYNFDPGPASDITITSLTFSEGFYTVIAVDPNDFNDYIIRLKYRSDTDNNYLYLDWD